MKRLLVVLAVLLYVTPAFSQAVTGSITAASSSCLSTNCVLLIIPNTQLGPVSAVTVQIAGTFAGVTANFEGNLDGTNWVAITGSPLSAGTGVTSATAAGIWQFNVAGLLGFRVRASAYTSGTAVVSIQASTGVPDDNNVTVTGTPSLNIAQVAGQSVTTNGNGVIAVAGAASGGLTVTIAGCSSTTCYTSPVMGAAITVSTTTVAPFGTTTTLVQGIHVNNITNAAVTVTITDGNNVPFVGTTTFGASYSIPAVSSLDVQLGLVGHVFTSGLNISTNTANAIRLWVEGRQ